MPRASFQHLSESRRAEILATAAQEFAVHGYHGTSYNQLLLRLGIGKSSAYHYFEDKADLFRCAVAEGYIRWFRGIGDITPPRTREQYWPFIFELNLNGYQFMLDDPTAAALIQCVLREASVLEQVLGADEVLSAVDGYHRSILTTGQQLGAVRSDLPIERLALLSRAVSSAEDQAFIRDVRRDGARAVAARLPSVAQQSTDMLRRLLEAPAAPSRKRKAPIKKSKQQTGR